LEAHSAKCAAHSFDQLVRLGSRALILSFVTLLLDVLGSKHFSRGARVVSSTQKAQILGRRRSTQREGIPMLDLNQPSSGAAISMLVDERALSLISLPNQSRDLDRNVARPRRKWAALPRLSRTEPSLCLAFDERVERAVEQTREIAGWDRMAQKLLGV